MNIESNINRTNEHRILMNIESKITLIELMNIESNTWQRKILCLLFCQVFPNKCDKTGILFCSKSYPTDKIHYFYNQLRKKSKL